MDGEPGRRRGLADEPGELDAAHGVGADLLDVDAAVGELADRNPDMKFVIEYKPREPRVHMAFDSVARTLLAIERIGLPNLLET